MRIFHLLSSSGFYGAEAMAAELVRQLEQLGHECHLGLFDNAGRGDREIIAATRIPAARVSILESRSQYDSRAVAQIAHYVRAQQIEIVHSHKEKTTFHALLARRHSPFKLVTTHHNWLSDNLKQRLYGALDKRLSRFCDARVGVSRAVVAELCRFGRSDRVSYVPNGVDTRHFQRSSSPSAARAHLGLKDLPTLGFVGRLTPLKGVQYLLEATAKLTLEAQLIIAGDGPDRSRLERKAELLGLKERVRFLGRCTDPRPAYCAMDLCVLPSLEEAFPMVLLEAMACEVPTIATRVGDVEVITEAGRTGWVVAPGDADALCDALSTALSDAGVLTDAGRAARERVRSTFSSASMAEKYVTVYRSALHGRTRFDQRVASTAGGARSAGIAGSKT
jgi:glycosyltransferase involved in cell wall biosynthesis